MSASYVPTGYQGVNACLMFDDVDVALAHYKEAFHAKEIMRMEREDGTAHYAEMEISGTRVFLSDIEWSWSAKTPAKLGGSSSNHYVYVANVDAAFERALRAGMTVGHSLEDMFWGDRCGGVVDKFGYGWMLAQVAGA